MYSRSGVVTISLITKICNCSATEKFQADYSLSNESLEYGYIFYTNGSL